MTLKPTDMLLIQSAIDDYEKKYPHRAVPSAEVALSWRLGKRAARRWAQQNGSRLDRPDLEPAIGKKSAYAQQECNWFVWAWERFRLQWNMWRGPRLHHAIPAGLLPWVRGALRVGWWSMVAVGSASLFFFGAIVGGFK